MTLRAPLRGVVFDKDGTLFDFEATWSHFCETILHETAEGDKRLLADLAQVIGYDIVNKRFLKNSIVIAETTETVVDHLLPLLPHRTKAELTDQLISASSAAPQVPAADLPVVLGQLSKMGLRLGVATNDNEAPARAHVSEAGVLSFFDLVLGYDSGFGGKPEPGQLHHFCAVTGTQPSECVMVGDSLHDLQAGAAAGMRTVGVLTGPAGREDLKMHAEVVLPSVAHLPEWVSGQL